MSYFQVLQSYYSPNILCAMRGIGWYLCYLVNQVDEKKYEQRSIFIYLV